MKILLERYLIQVKFVIFYEFKDAVGKIRYPTDIYCILRTWRFCWKDTLYHWNLLVLRIWRFCLKDTLSHWNLLFLTVEDSFLKRSYPNDIYEFQEFEDSVRQIPDPSEIYYFWIIWRFCWKDTLYHWNLLVFKNLKLLFERYFVPLRFIIF